MDNEYMEHAAYEVQVVLNCSKEDALRVVSWVNCLGGDPVDFIHRLPTIVGKAQPDLQASLNGLREVAARNKVKLEDVCFPTGYENRAARRKNKKRSK